MIKVISLLRRKDGMTHEAFVDHWLNVHGPLIKQNPALRRYVQSHIVEERVRHGARIEGEIDGIAEMWYDSVEAMQAGVRDPALAKAISEDGPKFIGANKSFIIDEKTIVELR